MMRLESNEKHAETLLGFLEPIRKRDWVSSVREFLKDFG